MRRATTPVDATPRAIKGYNLAEWSDNGMAYWAVSDLGASDLDAFARAFRNAALD